jgi:hypothetical protein
MSLQHWCTDTAPPCPWLWIQLFARSWCAVAFAVHSEIADVLHDAHTAVRYGASALTDAGLIILSFAPAHLWQRLNLAPIFKGER